MEGQKVQYADEKYQSPYKGFNRKKMNINAYATLVYQSPYKGFNSFT